MAAAQIEFQRKLLKHTKRAPHENKSLIKNRNVDGSAIIDRYKFLNGNRLGEDLDSLFYSVL